MYVTLYIHERLSEGRPAVVYDMNGRLTLPACYGVSWRCDDPKADGGAGRLFLTAEIDKGKRH